MAARRVLIVAPAQDLHARAVTDALQRRGVRVRVVDLSHASTDLRLAVLPVGAVDLEFGTATASSERLSDFTTVWWRRPRLPPDDPELDEVTRSYVASEWRAFLGGVEAAAGTTRWVNRPSAERTADFKPVQLRAAETVGLRVPDTVFTNDPRAARRLAERHTAVVFKRMGWAALPLTGTRLLTSDDLDRLGALPACPAIFQEHVPARADIRVLLFGDHAHATQIHSQEGCSPLDWRFDHGVPFVPHRLDTDVERKLFALLEALGLAYAAVDLRLTPAGEYVFLEANPSGQFLFAELRTRQPLCDTFAGFLAG